MGYVLLLLGILLVIIAWRPAAASWYRSGQAEDYLTHRATVELVGRLATLEGEVAAVRSDLARVLADACGGQAAVPATAGEGTQATPGFNDILAQAAKDAWREEVYQAYDAGENIDDLARRLGRGKGEIELILNLRPKS